MRKLLIAVLLAAASERAASDKAADDAFRAFWAADSPGAAEQAAERLLQARISFDEAWARLEAGRVYQKQPTGVITWRMSSPFAIPFENVVEIPADYDPSRAWPVRVQLHGGVGRPAPTEDTQRRPFANRIPGDKLIVIHPRAWMDTQWWFHNQVEHTTKLLHAAGTHSTRKRAACGPSPSCCRPTRWTFRSRSPWWSTAGPCSKERLRKTPRCCSNGPHGTTIERGFMARS